MGLVIRSEDGEIEAWRGSYGKFQKLREEIAAAANLPPLRLMENYFEVLGDKELLKTYPTLPIKWEVLREDDALYDFLTHSDCKGEIHWMNCKGMGERISELVPCITDEEARGWANKLVSAMFNAHNQRKTLVFS